MTEIIHARILQKFFSGGTISTILFGAGQSSRVAQAPDLRQTKDVWRCAVGGVDAILKGERLVIGALFRQALTTKIFLSHSP
jgi:hypothetical protein